MGTSSGVQVSPSSGDKPCWAVRVVAVAPSAGDVWVDSEHDAVKQLTATNVSNKARELANLRICEFANLRLRVVQDCPCRKNRTAHLKSIDASLWRLEMIESKQDLCCFDGTT